MNLAEFQKLMRDLYFKNDQTRGIHRTALWLVEEMADLYAWVASLANLLDIDLEKALESKYPSKCPKCNHDPCQCNRNLP